VIAIVGKPSTPTPYGEFFVEEAVDSAPDKIALRTSNGGVGPRSVVARGHAVEESGGAHASTSL
jgi:hypothetical protein